MKIYYKTTYYFEIWKYVIKQHIILKYEIYYKTIYYFEIWNMLWNKILFWKVKYVIKQDIILKYEICYIIIKVLFWNMKCEICYKTTYYFEKWNML